VVGRVRAAFNVERATRKFFDGFSKERDAFGKFVSGIPDLDMSKWYVSVMLNRLMFIYFIQKKGFLDGDIDYLRNRLQAMQATYGEDRFDRFYRYFLLRLFHDGLGKPNHDPGLQKLIGRVPYLNGGIFQIHEVEKRYPDIRIPDEAFERVFDFFDRYQWHLDDRPLSDDRQINPDVLGYIFEKYINQKQMGAYYTKEDITEYISKNTIIPFLFDRARADCKVAFEGEASVWALAAADPDRYIHEAVRKGTEHALPDEIAAGIEDVAARTLWNTPTPDQWALPTEIWRETVARRQRCEEVRLKLAGGEVRDINEFITLNLDIRQFAQDVIEQAEGADLLAAFWKALTSVSVLDPTCGSGAFLFAALNILEPLYEAAIARMREFTADEGWRRLHPRHAERFGAVPADIERHPNETYYIQKSIIVNNLYGVDIMEEAVEIARLRLFLKLAAQLESVDQVEPLPDIDFNIRAGNTLVGYVTREEVRDALTISRDDKGGEQRNLLFAETSDALAAVEEQAADIDRLYSHFRTMQTGAAGDGGEGAADLAATKAELQRRLAALNDTLDRALARQYGVDPDQGAAFDQWRSSHQPFHWFTEFYGILQEGGFDVVVGNPPYVARALVKEQYSVRGLQTIVCPDIYADCTARSLGILSPKGRIGLILPISFQFSSDFEVVRRLSEDALSNAWVSTFSRNPSALFSAGLGVRNTILIGLLGADKSNIINCSRLLRWVEGLRPILFQTIEYNTLPNALKAFGWPRIDNPELGRLFQKLIADHQRLDGSTTRSGDSQLRYKNIALYYISSFVTDPPCFNASGQPIAHTGIGALKYSDATSRDIALGTAIGKLALLWWAATGDDFHVTNTTLGSTPLDPAQLPAEVQTKLKQLVERIQQRLDTNIIYTKYAGKWIGNYDMKMVRDLTDEADVLTLDALGLSHYWDSIELAYARFMKMTGERPGTVRESPFG